MHITSGEVAGNSLAKSAVEGEVFVWRDILYEGLRHYGWPSESDLIKRAKFLSEQTGGGVSYETALVSLTSQYERLENVATRPLVLWFDACLFDQSMLVHILACLRKKGTSKVHLICIDAFSGIEPFDGLGQLAPEQLASLYSQKLPVTAEQFDFACTVDKAFALQDKEMFKSLAQSPRAPLPFIPAAITRWLEEYPDPATGLGRLEALAIEAIKNGCDDPSSIYNYVASNDIHPQYWGDITLWAKLNGLANRNPALVKIHGPTKRLPQWDNFDRKGYVIRLCNDKEL